MGEARKDPKKEEKNEIWSRKETWSNIIDAMLQQ